MHKGNWLLKKAFCNLGQFGNSKLVLRQVSQAEHPQPAVRKENPRTRLRQAFHLQVENGFPPTPLNPYFFT